MPDIVTVIRRKRDGHELSGAEIDWVIEAFTHGIVSDARWRPWRWRSGSAA